MVLFPFEMWIPKWYKSRKIEGGIENDFVHPNSSLKFALDEPEMALEEYIKCMQNMQTLQRGESALMLVFML